MSRNTTLRNIHVLLALGAMSMAGAAQAQNYVRVDMEIDVAKPAAEVWEKIGGYCDISVWFNGLDCEITSGDGGLGTVRVLAGGRVTEILVAKTDLSYAYTQPAVEGQFYNLYHGQLWAMPVTANSSKLLYTLVYDASNLENQEAVEADMARRRGMFEGALATMKELAEPD